jgi:hypothetical protein
MGAPDAATQLMDVATTAAPTPAPLAKDHPKQPKEAVAPALPTPAAPDAAEADEDEAPRRVLLVAKWNKQEIDLCVDASLTVGDLKIILESETTVPPEPGQEKRAKFPTSKAPISAVFHSFRLIFGRAIISRNGLEAWMLFPERARAEHSR